MEEIIYIIGVLISIVAVICFFVLCANVASIKKAINKPATVVDLMGEYNKHLIWGRSVEALTALENAIYLEWSTAVASNTNEHFRTEKYDELKQKYTPHLAKLGGQFPERDRF